jgi:hypothetical protein
MMPHRPSSERKHPKRTNPAGSGHTPAAGAHPDGCSRTPAAHAAGSLFIVRKQKFFEPSTDGSSIFVRDHEEKRSLFTTYNEDSMELAIIHLSDVTTERTNASLKCQHYRRNQVIQQNRTQQKFAVYIIT